MKKLIGTFLLCFVVLSVAAQWKSYNPMDAGFPVIQNQGFISEIGKTYARLPDRAKEVVRQPLWDLSRNSAGLAVYFYSNAPQITVRYKVAGGYSMPHMPATGVSGVDMYGIDSNGLWNLCSGAFSFGDTIQYTYKGLGKDKAHDLGFEYRLYLPLYNSVTWMEINVPENSEFSFLPASAEKPIVVYGTSIAQGACASRPAMAWTNIVQRSVGFPLVNLGFSGNGKLEKEVLNFINEIEARLYIIDCLPNLPGKNEEEITNLIIAAVKQIREKHTTPILLVEHAGYSNAPTEQAQYDSYTLLNKASRKAYEKLLAEKIENVYYLSHDELNLLPDSWVDSVHPSDLGMHQQAAAVEKKVREILRTPLGNASTQIPVTQRREPHVYEWQTRHRAIIDHTAQYPPKAVIMGNSITHYWGGEPVAPRAAGAKIWDKVMRPAGFQNMGYGWDRIENVLWRVYHGELDGFNAEKIVLMIGTNNLDYNNDQEIVEGLQFLVSAIRDRQPNAKIKVMGILPRRNYEERVMNLNKSIKEMTLRSTCEFADPGLALLQKDGKINEKVFSDGLHPNENGYKRIATEIAK